MANVAHDLINAVATIQARAQLTRRRVDRVDTLSRDHIGADLAQIEVQAQRVARLVAGLRPTGRRRDDPEPPPSLPPTDIQT